MPESYTLDQIYGIVIPHRDEEMRYATQYLHAPGSPEGQRLRKLFNGLAAQPGGREMQDFILKNKLHLAFSREADYAAYQTVNVYKPGGEQVPLPGLSFIMLNPDRADADLAAILPHELQHARQNEGGVLRSGLWVSPFDFAWRLRMIEADADANAVVQAFRAKQAGDDTAFEILRGMGKDMLCKAAEQEHARDPRSLETGTLKRKVFDAWFEGAHGQALKNAYDKQVIDTGWAETNQALLADPDHAPPMGVLLASDIAKLDAVQPDGVAYLSLPGFRDLDDPYYRGGFSPKNRAALMILTQEWAAQQHLRQRVPQKQGKAKSLKSIV